MINLQLYVEIMSLGAEGRGREEQGDQPIKVLGGEKHGKALGKPRRPSGALAKPGRTGVSGQPCWGWI